ncbi:glycosyltransferase family 4 protein [Telmatocola sphagniphila]|uniref:Glycosyltransferase family 4 protein n=2 Tax=Telmatocola sphagniphila TaxID=1123043 RepID=A0A8E6BB92_9BACT|nr:glycosyltransferase family 4 protein [Telmatocola sphagniphila]
MDRANYALADYLSNHGRTTCLVAHRAESGLTSRPTIRFHRVPKPLGSYFLGSWKLASKGKRIAQGAIGCRFVSNGGNCRSSDINWVHYVHSAYKPDSSLGLLRKLKTSVERPINLRAERSALLSARVVVCNSNRTREDVIRIGVPPDRAKVVYYGTDPSRFSPISSQKRSELRSQFNWPESRPVVCFIGALSDRRKGFDTLFNAWKDLCKSTEWDAILVVIGRGAELPFWEQKCRDEGMTDRIRFLGFRSDVPNLLSAADLLVAPTRYEAYGLGIHEAICCGLPAIVSADAGVSEHFPEELREWLLVDPNSSADLVAKLQLWRNASAASLSMFHSLGVKLRSRSWSEMGTNFMEAIGEPLS